MKTLGIIGGLGPMATAYFMQLVIEMTQAVTDQEHIPMIIYNCPQIPDRTRFLLGLSQEDPVPGIVRCGGQLAADGAQILAIPCITAHAMHERIQERVELPIIHAIKETAIHLKEAGIKRVALEATDGTVQTGVFQKELEAQQIEVILPSREGQQKVMDIIYHNVKAGIPVDMDKFAAVEQELLAKEAQVIILGCTELSMVKQQMRNPEVALNYGLQACYLDAMEVLARAAVKACGKLRQKYESLLY